MITAFGHQVRLLLDCNEVVLVPPTELFCSKLKVSGWFLGWTLISTVSVDIDSRVGTYAQVNPTLCTPDYINATMFETDRQLLTRFRCGSHSLAVEKGRYSNIPRDERLCSCGTDVQTVLHCFSDCPTTRHLFQGKEFTTLHDVFLEEDVCVLLHKMCKELRISVWAIWGMRRSWFMLCGKVI